MVCTVTLSYDDENIVHVLQKAWGKKHVCTFKHNLGNGQKQIRVVVEIDNRQISGFLKIESEEIGLPQRRLNKTAIGLSAHWPPANGITVKIDVTDIETQIVDRRTKQWFGVFKNIADCKCKIIGPKNTRPTVPDGFRHHSFHDNQLSANQAKKKCENSLPERCFQTSNEETKPALVANRLTINVPLVKCELTFVGQVPNAFHFSLPINTQNINNTESIFTRQFTTSINNVFYVLSFNLKTNSIESVQMQVKIAKAGTADSHEIIFKMKSLQPIGDGWYAAAWNSQAMASLGIVNAEFRGRI